LPVELPDKAPFVADMKVFATDEARAHLITGRTLPVDVPFDRRILQLGWPDAEQRSAVSSPAPCVEPGPAQPPHTPPQ
jgi:hypothetical protein